MHQTTTSQRPYLPTAKAEYGKSSVFRDLGFWQDSDTA